MTHLCSSTPPTGWAIPLRAAIPDPQHGLQPQPISSAPVLKLGGESTLFNKMIDNNSGGGDGSSGGGGLPVSSAGGANAIDQKQPWLHSKMDNLKANGILAGKKEGAFIVREHVLAKDKYALSVVFKGITTHHLITTPTGKPASVGKTQLPVQGLPAAVTYLREVRDKYWPVALGNHVDVGGGAPQTRSTPVVASTITTTTVTPTSSKKTDIDLSKNPADASEAWLHEKMSNDEAKVLLDGKPDGVFIVRKYKPDKSNYALSVVFQSAVTHHSLKTPPGAKPTINKTELPVSGLADAVGYLRQTRLPYWPIALGDHVERTESAANTAPEPAAPTKTSSPAPTAAEPKHAQGVEQLRRASPSTTSSGGSSGYAAVDAAQEWMHEKMSSEEAKALMAGKPEGTFCVRRRDDPTSFALTVVYNSRATHHSLKCPVDGKASVGKSELPVSGLSDAVAHLRAKQTYWPVPLKEHIPGSAGLKNAVVTILEVDAAQEWLHGKMSTEEATKLAAHRPDGTFFVRRRDDSTNFALTVVYQSKATHHSLKCPADGKAVIGKSELPVSGLSEAVAHLRSKQTYWPVPLDEHIPPSAGLKNAVVTILEVDAAQEWLHGKMSTEEATKLAAHRPDGTFFVRRRDDSTNFALTVVYQSKATHHSLKCPADGKAVIGKSELPVSGLSEAVAHLRSKQTYWPVPLDEHIPPSARHPNSASAVSSPAMPARSSKPAAPTSTAGLGWLHEKMSNDEAKALVAGKEDGTFLVRKRDESAAYALTVVYQSRATHHLLKCPVGGNASVGKSELPVSGLSEAVAHLRSKQRYWPVPLGEHIVAGSSPDDAKAWLHDEMSSADKNSLLAGKPDGTFLVARHKDAFALSVVYGGKGTHHRVQAADGESASVGKRQFDGVQGIVAVSDI